MKTYTITILILFELLLSLNIQNIYGQTINITAPDYISSCSGRMLSIPTTLTGTFSNNNQFVLKLTEYTWSGDTTIYITAHNNTTPLQFQIPNIYASKKKASGYFLKYTIASTAPIVVSNEKTLTLNLPPTVQLGSPLQYVSDLYSGYYMINDYCSFDKSREISYLLYPGSTNNDTYFKTNTNAIVNNSSYSGKFYVNPSQTTTYRVDSVWNNCGNGRILLPNSVTIIKNPFKIKITDIFPKNICEDRNINVGIDYLGVFNSNNQFIIEIANVKGDTVWKMPNTVVNGNQLSTTLSSTFASGTYHLRVRATNPDLATDYLPIRILQKPNIELYWISGATNPIDYKNDISLRVYSYGSNIHYPTYMKFSDGTTINYFGGVSGGSMADITIKPQNSIFFKLDSLVTTCGVGQSYSIVGERNLIVSKNFYVEDLPKIKYCTGEKVRFKLNSVYQFSPQNQFTAKIKIQGAATLNIPVTIDNNGFYEFIIPDDSNFTYSFWQFTFQIEATNPQQISAVYHEVIKVHSQPDIRVSTPNFTVSSPSKTYFRFPVRLGLKPVYVTMNNGNEDFISEVGGSSENFETDIYVEVPVPKSMNFKIKGISNTCGSKTYLPSRDFTVTVTNPPQRVIQLKKSPKNICLGSSYQLEIDTTGIFQSNDEFIVTLQYNANSRAYTYEIGRSSGRQINIQIPSMIPLQIGLNSCSILVSSRLTETENLPYLLRYSTCYINSNQTASFSYMSVANETQSYSSKKITILKGEALTFRVESPTTIPKDTFQIKINNQWFYNNYENDSYISTAQPFVKTFRPLRDTTLILEGMIYRCGQSVQRDTIRICVKKNRIQAKIIQSGTRCQNSLIDVSFNVEGDLRNLPTEYKFYFIPVFDNSKRFEAVVINKTLLKYTLKIPEMPYENNFKIEVTPTTPINDFILNYYQDQIYINKKSDVKVTGMDGSQIAWTDGMSSHVSIKLETLNSNNPSWQGLIVSDLPNPYYSNNVAVYGSKVYKASVYSTVDYVYSLKNVENTCGYGNSRGQVTVKFCNRDLILPNYTGYRKEYFSSTFIKSNDAFNSNSSILYSSKNFVELLPGFKAQSPQQLFDVQVKGCLVIP